MISELCRLKYENLVTQSLIIAQKIVVKEMDNIITYEVQFPNFDVP